MLKRLCAICLAVLAALPFTAPFASLDLSDILAGSAHNITETVAAPVDPAGAHDNELDDGAASIGCFQRIHLIGADGLVPLTSPAADALAIGSAVFVTPPSLQSTRTASALAGTLRV